MCSIRCATCLVFAVTHPLSNEYGAYETFNSTSFCSLKSVGLGAQDVRPRVEVWRCPGMCSIRCATCFRMTGVTSQNVSRGCEPCQEPLKPPLSEIRVALHLGMQPRAE